MPQQALQSFEPIRLYGYGAIKNTVITGGQLPFMLGNEGLQGYLGQKRVTML